MTYFITNILQFWFKSTNTFLKKLKQNFHNMIDLTAFFDYNYSDFKLLFAKIILNVLIAV